MARPAQHPHELPPLPIKAAADTLCSEFDLMNLIPLDSLDEQETWLCSAKQHPGDVADLESWPIDIDDELGFDDSESVSSISVQCEDFVGTLDIADWYGPDFQNEDVQLLFPVNCTNNDMGWLLLEEADAVADLGVELLFPVGCTETDKEWLVSPSGCSTLDDIEWLVAAESIEGNDQEDSC